MILYYENSNGEKLDLLKKPYRAVEADVFDSKWQESSSGYEKKIEIDVFDSAGDLMNNMNRLYDLLAVDADNGVYGKLWCNGSYIRCNVKEKTVSGWKGGVYAYVMLTFSAPDLAWITEETRQFMKIEQDTDVDGKNYPYNYPFDYSVNVTGDEQWNIDHVTPSDFSMIIYGLCAEPYVRINDHVYAVDTTLDTGEYLIIDSQTQTIIKHLADGTDINMFNNRSTQESVFTKIQPGMNKISWTGAFGFDIVLYKARKEPKWM